MALRAERSGEVTVQRDGDMVTVTAPIEIVDEDTQAVVMSQDVSAQINLLTSAGEAVDLLVDPMLKREILALRSRAQKQQASEARLPELQQKLDALLDSA